MLMIEVAEMRTVQVVPPSPHVPLDPKIAAAIAARAGMTPIYQMPLTQGRPAYDQLLAESPKLNDPVASIKDLAIPGPASKVPIRVYAPEAQGKRPILLFIHGGGWVCGSLDSHDDLCRSLCSRGEVVVVSVDYRRAPEHRFPAQLEDCFHALRWCADSGLGDDSKLAVAGDSAGGNLTAALALYARDRQGPKLSLQIPIYPVTNRNFDTASYHEYAEGYGLLRDAMIYYWDSYIAAPEDAINGYAAPLQAADLRDLPPALIQTAQYDVLRDEGEAYAIRLRKAGVPVICTRYQAMNHGFAQFAAALADGRSALAEISSSLLGLARRD